MPGAIVIGAGPGIGAAVARRFAADGLPVALIARSDRTVEQTAAAIPGTAVLGLTADSTDEAGLKSALDAAIAAHGVPDALVYNAALIRPDRIGELSARELLDALHVNVVGALTAAGHLGPLLAERGSGTILITGGMPQPRAAYTSLSLGKTGVRTVVELLAQEYGPAGVHVASVTVTGAVAPGGPFDPDDIAEEYAILHAQAPDEWETERVYSGRPVA